MKSHQMDHLRETSETQRSPRPQAGGPCRKELVGRCLLLFPFGGLSDALSLGASQFITFNEHKIHQDIKITKHQWAVLDVPSNCCFSSFFHRIIQEDEK